MQQESQPRSESDKLHSTEKPLSSANPNDRNLQPERFERRRVPRQSTSRSVAVIPILANLEPGTLQWADADLQDVSAIGLSLRMDRSTPLECERLVIGAESSGGGRAFATVIIETQAPQDGQLRVGASWASNQEGDLLEPNRLKPRIDPATLSFVHGWDDATLEEWTKLGVMRRFVVDRVLLCDRCGSLPSWRQGCHICGSGRIHLVQWMRHQPCGHLGPAVSFEADHGHRCPRCFQEGASENPNFQHVPGQQQCCDCGAKGGHPTMAAMCHRCHHRFSVSEAEERVLYAYHVERLDPLTLLS